MRWPGERLVAVPVLLRVPMEHGGASDNETVRALRYCRSKHAMATATGPAGMPPRGCRIRVRDGS